MKLTLATFLLVSLAAVHADHHLWHSTEIDELKWCCSNVECWSSCANLCAPVSEGGQGDGRYCFGGARHPVTIQQAQGAGDETLVVNAKQMMDELLEATGADPPPTWMEDSSWWGITVNIPNPRLIGPAAATPPEDEPEDENGGGFFRRRLYEFDVEIAGCGPFPVTVTEAFVECIASFFFGDEKSQAHCAAKLPQLGGECLFRGLSAAETGGEPHFKTWHALWYDYHGECDMVLLHAPSFANGLGLDIHIRTRIRNDYSFIESVAIKIDNDILEVGGWGQYVYNGVAGGSLLDATVGPFELTYNPESKKVHHFQIGAGNRVVKVKTVKDFVSVSLSDHPQAEDFSDSEGMLGQYGSEGLFGRDGTTMFTLDNINEFGQEWQVRPEEPKLFENVDREPQFPAQCLLPQVSTREQRRLGERGVSEEQARQACSGWDASHRPKCVYDVLATGDLELAEAGGY